jgi:hypothetical protein
MDMNMRSDQPWRPVSEFQAGATSLGVALAGLKFLTEGLKADRA